MINFSFLLSHVRTAVQPNIVVPAIFRSKNQMTDFHHKTTEAWTDDDRDDVLHHFSKSVVPTVPTIPQGKKTEKLLQKMT